MNAPVYNRFPCADYDDRDAWLLVGLDLFQRGAGSEQAFAEWTTWSNHFSKYNAGDQRRAWNSFAQRPNWHDVEAVIDVQPQPDTNADAPIDVQTAFDLADDAHDRIDSLGRAGVMTVNAVSDLKDGLDRTRAWVRNAEGLAARARRNARSAHARINGVVTMIDDFHGAYSEHEQLVYAALHAAADRFEDIEAGVSELAAVAGAAAYGTVGDLIKLEKVVAAQAATIADYRNMVADLGKRVVALEASGVEHIDIPALTNEQLSVYAAAMPIAERGKLVVDEAGITVKRAETKPEGFYDGAGSAPYKYDDAGNGLYIGLFTAKPSYEGDTVPASGYARGGPTFNTRLWDAERKPATGRVTVFDDEPNVAGSGCGDHSCHVCGDRDAA